MKLIMKIAAALVALALSTGAAAATLADIISAGKIVVGVKQDYRPWGYLDAQGNIIGLEIDLAKDVARQLGVGLELVPVVASNRMEFLQQGRIDLIIATMGDNEKRRKVVGMIEPNYEGLFTLFVPRLLCPGLCQSRRAERSLVIPNERQATPSGAVRDTTRRAWLFCAPAALSIAYVV